MAPATRRVHQHEKAPLAKRGQWSLSKEDWNKLGMVVQPVNPALGRLRQTGFKLKASVSYRVRPYLRTLIRRKKEREEDGEK